MRKTGEGCCSSHLVVVVFGSGYTWFLSTPRVQEPGGTGSRRSGAWLAGGSGVG